ncbi:MAG: transposase [Thermoplasma acidophilum]|nr:transposase [Thermoplasma acidophilum]
MVCPYKGDKADISLIGLSCTQNASRSFLSQVRTSDRNDIDSDLKGIFLSGSKEEAIKRFDEFKSKWSSKHPKAVYSMEKNLTSLLKYYEYPESVRRSIHSMNIIEKMKMKICGRIKIIDSLHRKRVQ